MVKKLFNKIVTPKNISRFIQFWAAGAIYFLVAWGTNIGRTGLIDLVFFLGLGIGIIEMFVLKPILAEINDEKPASSYMDKTILQKSKERLIYIFKAMFTVALVMFTYFVINNLLQRLLSLPSGTAVLLGEPFLFGFLYMVYARTIVKVQMKSRLKRSVVS
ncbi:hypothetical protein LZ578_00445 [Jeotgalibaca sp. MA1X17-3]|uniref:hypothetical protein n=1 Tax=Jeotgalibaca sp. MA1X17-3 TaxID=2908211 RepID=UPI001F4589C9|nr:hypothetical protein [Jeotgalibaca sp. MA1X17-3]UJF15715.1 hypothetical protein LZ578_00445 [Jeotgalibaca sp. MA1X17-3]